MSVEGGTAVVVPMYNEGDRIGGVLPDLLAMFERVICVDDGSDDDSAAVATATGATVLHHEFNLGQGAALQTGIEFALRNVRTEYIVTFDADGQHRAVDALGMVRKARAEGLDLVLGSRFTGEQSSRIPAARRHLLRAAVSFTRISTGMPVTDTHNGLRVLNRDIASRVRITLSGMAHASELLSQFAALQLRWAEYPVLIDYSDYGRGQSNVNAVNIVLDLIARRIRPY